MAKILTNEEYKILSSMYDKGSTWEKTANVARIFQNIKQEQWHSESVPVKEFKVEVKETLPPLAWICEIIDSRYNFIIGGGVEFGRDYIVEGVWDDNFAEANFVASAHFYGSGAKLNKDNICVFVPPKLCTDYLFVLHDKIEGITRVSNSFNFLFARAGIDLESIFFIKFRENINVSTNEESALGADRGNPLIAETDDMVIYRMMYHNFTVDDKGKINYLMKVPEKLSIPNFDAYRQFLYSTTRKLIDNGAHPSRKRTLNPVTMLSTGYDSCATSAICAACGVKDAVTLDVTVGGHDDCGEKIAKSLGLQCHKVISPLGKVVPVLKAAISKDSNLLEFIATAGIGDNVVFKTMEDMLKGKIVFSGLYGDGCWSKEGNGSGLAHHLPYMKSRMEFRLRTGYTLVPTPAFGAYFPYFLKNINADREMKPWILNNSYDRPIPRRIAEEAGVARELFGMRKAANNPDIVNYKDLFTDAVRHVTQRYKT